MIPTIDSTKLKYISDCLLKVNKDAPVQLGEKMVRTKDIWASAMITIEDRDGKNVIDTQPFITQAENIKRGLDRYKGTISFAEDGKSHDIGTDVTVCHTLYDPGEIQTVPNITNIPFTRRAAISTASLRILAAQIPTPKDEPIVYLRNDSDGHYVGILDVVRIRLKGNIEPPAYTTIAATYLKRLSQMARNTVTVEWNPEGLTRFGWEAYGLNIRLYVAPRMISDENMIKRLDRKVIL